MVHIIMLHAVFMFSSIFDVFNVHHLFNICIITFVSFSIIMLVHIIVFIVYFCVFILLVWYLERALGSHQRRCHSISGSRSVFAAIETSF